MKFPNIWAHAQFKSLSMAFGCYTVCSWMLTAAIPILVTMKFGAGAEMIGSIALRLLPRIVLGPLLAALIRRIGARSSALLGIGVMVALGGTLPFADDLFIFQLLVFFLGVADGTVSPAHLTLLGAVIPLGKNMEANTVFQAIDRGAKIFGPPIAGGLIPAIGIHETFLLIAAGQFAALLLIAFGLGRVAGDGQVLRHDEANSFSADLRAILNDRVLWALVIPALGYMIAVGALTPFLFWLNQDQFRLAPEQWTILLAAQGVGALLGAALANFLGKRLFGLQALLLAYLLASLLEALSTMALAFTSDQMWAVTVLIAGGIPEMVAFAAYFSLVQMRIPVKSQAVFYAATLPLLDAFVVLGLMSGFIYTSGVLDLHAYWFSACALGIVPVLPFLLMRKQLPEIRRPDTPVS